MQGKKLQFPRDVIGAVTGGVSSISDGMACAVMAGLNPVLGLYSTIVGPIIGSWTTSSVYMSVTTTSALALAMGSALVNVAAEDKVIVAGLITLLAGLIQIILSLFNLDIFLRFVSNAVMRGFLSGIAVQIIVGQVDDFTGKYESSYSHRVLKAADILIHPQEWNWWVFITGMLTVCIILLLKKSRLKFFSMFIALVIMNIVAYFSDVEALILVGEKSPIPKEIPPLHLPDYVRIPNVILSAISIALIGFIQGAGVGHMRRNPNGKFPDNAVDLRAQGLSNVVIGFTAGIPVGGSVSASSLMYSVGVRSRWGIFLSGIFIAVMVFFFSSLIERIPLVTFAAILIVTGYEALNKEQIMSIWKTSFQSGSVMMFSFISTLVLPVQLAVILSIVLTFLLHVVRSSNKVSLHSIEPFGDLYHETPLPKNLESNKVIGILPYGSLFFAGALVMKKDFPNPEFADRSVVIFILRGKEELGSTIINILIEYSDKLKNRNSKLILVGVSENVYQQLERIGMLEHLGRENVYKGTDYIGKNFREVWEESEEWVRKK